MYSPIICRVSYIPGGCLGFLPSAGREINPRGSGLIDVYTPLFLDKDSLLQVG